MIEFDEKWTPQVTVIGIGEQSVRVLLKLKEKKREGMKLCAIVLDETQVTQHDDQISKVYVGGELVETSDPLPGEQTIRFNVANADDEIRFVYVSEAGSTAVLKMFVSARGFTISFR